MQQLNEWMEEISGKFLLGLVDTNDLEFVQKVIAQYMLGGPEWAAGEFLCKS